MHTLMKQAATLERYDKEAKPSPATCEELNPVNNHMSLQVDPSLGKPSDETAALADTLIAVL